MEKKSLSGLTLNELQEVSYELGMPRFAAKQMAEWLYKKQIFTIAEMTNLSKESREKLSAQYELGRRNPLKKMVSSDGTIKYLFPTQSGHYIETVYIPKDDRATLCVSSQVGCKMGCKFCMTGRQGFQAQLTAGDILNQIYALPDFAKLTNIVFMGQGEPFDNTENVLKACEILTASYGLAWSPKRITVSSVGDLKGLKRFLDESQCNIAISLHFPLPGQRLEYMPAEKAWPILKVIDLLKEYEFCNGNLQWREGAKQRRLSFEYIVFAGVNDSHRHRDAIVELLSGLDCRVNLIPFHTIPGTPFKAAPEQRMKEIRDYLTYKGVFSTLRASRGQDIMAACGLLSTAKREADNAKDIVKQK